jgi:hypothetical protein
MCSPTWRVSIWRSEPAIGAGQRSSVGAHRVSVDQPVSGVTHDPDHVSPMSRRNTGARRVPPNRPSALSARARGDARRATRRAAPSSSHPPWSAPSPGGASRSSATGRGGGRPPSPTRRRGRPRPRRPRGRSRVRRGSVARPARHALRSQSNGSGGSASRIVIPRSVVAGLCLSPRPDWPNSVLKTPSPEAGSGPVGPIRPVAETILSRWLVS